MFATLNLITLYLLASSITRSDFCPEISRKPDPQSDLAGTHAGRGTDEAPRWCAGLSSDKGRTWR